MPEMRSLRPARLEAFQPTAASLSPLAHPAAASIRLEWRALLKPAIMVWAAARVLAVVPLLLAALLAHRSLGPEALLRQWDQWDAGWYISIAQHGYYSAASAGFFPLFPALSAELARVLGGNVPLAAMIIANLSSFAATLGIGLLASHEDGTATAGTRAILAMATYPLAFYLIAPYSEGIFLAFAIFALYFARRAQWPGAAICAGLAGLSRPTSLVLLLPLLWEYGRQRGWWARDWWRPERWRALLTPRTLGAAALALGALPAAIGAYMVFLAIRFGDPLLYTHAETATWHHISLPFFQTLWLMVQSALHPPTSTLFKGIMVLDFSAFLAVLTITILWARRLPFAYTLYNLGLLFLLLSAPIPDRPEIITSGARYLLTAFPIFLVASRWMKGRPRVALALLGIGCVLQAVFLVWFLTGHWVE